MTILFLFEDFFLVREIRRVTNGGFKSDSKTDRDAATLSGCDSIGAVSDEGTISPGHVGAGVTNGIG